MVILFKSESFDLVGIVIKEKKMLKKKIKEKRNKKEKKRKKELKFVEIYI